MKSVEIMDIEWATLNTFKFQLILAFLLAFLEDHGRKQGDQTDEIQTDQNFEELHGRLVRFDQIDGGQLADLKLFDGHIRIAQLPKLQTNIVGALNEIEIQMAGLVSKDIVNEEARLAGPNAVLVG